MNIALNQIHTPMTQLLCCAVVLMLQPGSAHGDIYRFVTTDGVESFTDAPVSQDAKIVIREKRARDTASRKRADLRPAKEISLNEVVEKAVQSSLSASDTESPLPELPPVGGVITSGVGMRIDPIDGKWRMHNGIDIAIAEGTPVMPVGRGVVIYSGLRPGYGNTILIEHDNGMISLYGHNSTLKASVGQQVTRETTIALSGSTGRSTGPHLHFEAWHRGKNLTSLFMPGSGGNLPKIQLASSRSRAQFRKEILSDGSILFTNLP